MTIIKQRAVTENGHQRNLRAYINDDKKVLLRDSQNMDGCTNIKRWATFMETTRRRFGHDKASRMVRDKKTGELRQSRNTIMYHQILAFLPDECDINGGKLTPEECMAYAKEYAAKFYPNQQVVFALHNEYCKEDKTHRYAVHMVINRSDIQTKKRLNEGRGQKAKVERASRIRKMDKAWGLKQVERDERNSSVHKKQPSKVEKEIEGRGGESYKMNLRELCRLAADKAENIYEYREMLEGWGVDTQFRKGRLYVTDTDNSKYSFSLAKLDADLNANGLEERFLQNVEADIEAKGAEIAEARATGRALSSGPVKIPNISTLVGLWYATIVATHTTMRGALMYLNEILPGNWREDEWPEHIEVSHESSRFKSRRYVPRVNSANKSSANPVDGIWCSHCGWAGVIAQDMTDFDEYSEPQFDSLAEDVPTFCPKCGSLLMY